jgi:hypothetical protein
MGTGFIALPVLVCTSWPDRHRRSISFIGTLSVSHDDSKSIPDWSEGGICEAGLDGTYHGDVCWPCAPAVSSNGPLFCAGPKALRLIQNRHVILA